MNRLDIYALNTPEMEIQFELMLIACGRRNDLIKLIKSGWGLYPQVLNALIACDGIFVLPMLRNILIAAGKHGNYDAEKMKLWLENYYGSGWKRMVEELGLDAIAAEYLTDKKCVKTNYSAAANLDFKDSSWEKLAKAEGIDSVKNTYLKMGKTQNPDACATEKKLLIDLEHYLCWRGEYEFLYGLQCWRGLSSSLDGVRYIAETKHYTNGIASCLLAYSDQMPPNAVEYCVSVLDKASLDDDTHRRYLEWKDQH